MPTVENPFVEDPTMRIVGVHWADDDGGPPEPPTDTAYCGAYGFGARMELRGSLITAIPYGPNQFPPMVGTFSTTGGNIGPAGENYGFMAGVPLHPIDTMTAAPYGLIAYWPFLEGNFLTFTNQQLAGIQDYTGAIGTIKWAVPMATGRNASGVPIVIKKYTVNMSWLSHFVAAGDQVGIGISHPLTSPPVGFVYRPPPAPHQVLGPRSGGSGTFVYDFKYEQLGDVAITVDNQYDRALGGPAWVWWMTRSASGAWGGSQIFMGTTLVGLNDWYLWDIVAECQPMPALDS
jgi:hypothetical protein